MALHQRERRAYVLLSRPASHPQVVHSPLENLCTAGDTGRARPEETLGRPTPGLLYSTFLGAGSLAPFVKLARTVRHYRESIEATIEWRLTSGIAESVNAAIGRLRTNARGFHDAEAFITMVMLDRAGIAHDLPWAATA